MVVLARALSGSPSDFLRLRGFEPADMDGRHFIRLIVADILGFGLISAECHQPVECRAIDRELYDDPTGPIEPGDVAALQDITQQHIRFGHVARSACWSRLETTIACVSVACTRRFGESIRAWREGMSGGRVWWHGRYGHLSWQHLLLAPRMHVPEHMQTNSAVARHVEHVLAESARVGLFVRAGRQSRSASPISSTTCAALFWLECQAAGT